MDSTERLKTELETYEREKPRLLAESEGKFVLIHGSDIAGAWDTYADAITAGYETFGLDAFLVKQIEAIDRGHFFTRDLVLCRS